MTVTRISLWSGPRNVSTALMYSFRQRPDTTVVDEPLYAYSLERFAIDHPGREEVLAAQDTDGERVVRDVILGPVPTPVAFFKNMARHLEGLDRAFLSELHNVILTRHPAEMLRSFIKQVPNPDLDMTGLPMQIDLLDWILADGADPLVLDSSLVLTDPQSVLEQLCERIGIPFDQAMLSWEAGPVPEDGVWAPYWYDSVHRSTGFAPYRPRDEEAPDDLQPLIARAVPLYERLLAYAITP
ncbi:MAG TPA: sulfotransferase family protein [Acidimicrobiia bacterium]|nr:sulfotransferase family protein [Acidimicrobiia bacterium]